MAKRDVTDLDKSKKDLMVEEDSSTFQMITGDYEFETNPTKCKKLTAEQIKPKFNMQTKSMRNQN